MPVELKTMDDEVIAIRLRLLLDKTGRRAAKTGIRDRVGSAAVISRQAAPLPDPDWSAGPVVSVSVSHRRLGAETTVAGRS